MAAVWNGRHVTKGGEVEDIAIGLDRVAAAWPGPNETTVVRMDNGGTFTVLMPFWDFVVRWRNV